MHWLREVPGALVRAYVAMLPRLEAQEQLAAISAAALGSGHVKTNDARRAIAKLERQAQGGRRKAVKATPQVLAGMGIAVVEQQAADDAEAGDV